MFVDENPLSCPFVHAVPAFLPILFLMESTPYTTTILKLITIDDAGKEEGYYSAAYLDNHTKHGVYKTKDIYGYIVEVTDEKNCCLQGLLYHYLC